MSNETRDKILITTSSLLEKQGYHATGLNQIVKESATPRGSLYYYFPEGKEELAAEAIQRRMKEMADFTRRFLSKIDDPIEAVVELIMLMAKQIEQNDCCSGAPIAAVALEASGSSERIRKACEEGYRGLQDVWAAKLVMGGYPADRANELAVMINAAIEGATVLTRTMRDAQPMITAAQNMKILLESARVE